MAFAHLELLTPSVIGLVCALYPLPWHLRNKNIGTLSMIFWMSSLNLIHVVDSIVWVDNSDIKVVNWCDFAALLTVGYNYGIPLSHLVLAKQLESLTTLRPRSALFDLNVRRRQTMIDMCIVTVLPVIGILVHLSMMDRRFYIIEGFGPLPATYWDTWGVIGMAIVPIVIALACAVYTVMALVNVHLRRQQLLSLIHSDATVNRDQFIRLLILAIAMLATCSLRAIFNLMSWSNGPQPMDHRGDPSHNMSIIETLTLDQVSDTGLIVLRLQWFTVVACSITFLFCFATGVETKTFYMKMLRRVLPCIPAERFPRQNKLGSYDSGASRSQGSNSHAGNLSYSRSDTVQTPTTGKQDVSLEEMLGSPQSPRKIERKQYDEEAADALYLEPMTGNK